eukprot:COSAG01_NODE_156_length_23748_cov_439.062371_10_plen_101_part_00
MYSVRLLDELMACRDLAIVDRHWDAIMPSPPSEAAAAPAASACRLGGARGLSPTVVTNDDGSRPSRGHHHNRFDRSARCECCHGGTWMLLLDAAAGCCCW